MTPQSVRIATWTGVNCTCCSCIDTDLWHLGLGGGKDHKPQQTAQLLKLREQGPPQVRDGHRRRACILATAAAVHDSWCRRALLLQPPPLVVVVVLWWRPGRDIRNGASSKAARQERQRAVPCLLRGCIRI